MKNEIFTTANGLTMVRCKPLNFRRDSVYAGSTDPPYFYHIYVGGIADGHQCTYDDGKKILSIAYTMYSSDDPVIKFKVFSIEEASKLVLKFANGMGVNLSNTIFHND